jgi:hypothetical protein
VNYSILWVKFSLRGGGWNRRLPCKPPKPPQRPRRSLMTNVRGGRYYHFAGAKRRITDAPPCLQPPLASSGTPQIRDITANFPGRLAPDPRPAHGLRPHRFHLPPASPADSPSSPDPRMGCATGATHISKIALRVFRCPPQRGEGEGWREDMNAAPPPRNAPLPSPPRRENAAEGEKWLFWM